VCQVVRGAGVHVPRWIHGIGRSRPVSRKSSLFLITTAIVPYAKELLLEAVVAASCEVAFDAIELARGLSATSRTHPGASAATRVVVVAGLRRRGLLGRR
jgi:hypothetical protein